MHVRQVAPFAAALQGRLTLHASCVGTASQAFAFVGPSGTGKSTFASTLADGDWNLLCDDLLPLRLFRESWCVPALDGPPLSLAGVYFLERGTSESSMEIERLVASDAMISFMQHGFGELPDSRIWQMQFEAYAQLARITRCFRLSVPHRLSELSQFARLWVQHAARSLDQ